MLLKEGATIMSVHSHPARHLCVVWFEVCYCCADPYRPCFCSYCYCLIQQSIKCAENKGKSIHISDLFHILSSSSYSSLAGTTSTLTLFPAYELPHIFNDNAFFDIYYCRERIVPSCRYPIFKGSCSSSHCWWT